MNGGAIGDRTRSRSSSGGVVGGAGGAKRCKVPSLLPTAILSSVLVPRGTRPATSAVTAPLVSPSHSGLSSPCDIRTSGNSTPVQSPSAVRCRGRAPGAELEPSSPIACSGSSSVRGGRLLSNVSNMSPGEVGAAGARSGASDRDSTRGDRGETPVGSGDEIDMPGAACLVADDDKEST